MRRTLAAVVGGLSALLVLAVPPGLTAPPHPTPASLLRRRNPGLADYRAVEWLLFRPHTLDDHALIVARLGTLARSLEELGPGVHLLPVGGRRYVMPLVDRALTDVTVDHFDPRTCSFSAVRRGDILRPGQL